MSNQERKIAMLVLDNGKCPVREWLEGVRDKPTRARITRQINKLALGLGDQKGLQGVAELKMDFGPGYRAYYAYLDAKTLVVLLGGGDKETQSKDIARARKLWEQVSLRDRAKLNLGVWKTLTEASAQEEPPAPEEADEEADT